MRPRWERFHSGCPAQCGRAGIQGKAAPGLPGTMDPPLFRTWRGSPPCPGEVSAAAPTLARPGLIRERLPAPSGGSSGSFWGWWKGQEWDHQEFSGKGEVGD